MGDGMLFVFSLGENLQNEILFSFFLSEGCSSATKKQRFHPKMERSQNIEEKLLSVLPFKNFPRSLKVKGNEILKESVPSGHSSPPSFRESSYRTSVYPVNGKSFRSGMAGKPISQSSNSP
jgi:hypothetical protein